MDLQEWAVVFEYFDIRASVLTKYFDICVVSPMDVDAVSWHDCLKHRLWNSACVYVGVV